MMMQIQGEPGSFHRNLVNNTCPKCEQALTFIAMTDDQLIRKCKKCELTIIDPLDGGEYPENVCEICD